MRFIEENASPPAPDVVQRVNAAEVPYHVILAPEGKATDDGRIFAPGSIGWRELPLSLMAMTETPGEGGHAGAELCGKINSIYRDDSSKPTLIEGDGVFEDSYRPATSRTGRPGFLTQRRIRGVA